ncbi:hypothetical protein VC83_01009 [Pseudogymnoascus destructans]|uniref:Uncharacterized protein n=2 Tax=Pseudogymnoascus destructans TaxID=655981 RepID=L8FP40_PSED2|nr:uncharacterized protein VC83_01009 [Pseudogymnoascus destructans]ELR02652.1 hypothetical protein GMDG_05613 [Pseudogymnoascus destructans 20631-21]OAF62503.1 hypothetical protein VC83_01009 [Pseudogymnoascus destructans]
MVGYLRSQFERTHLLSLINEWTHSLPPTVRHNRKSIAFYAVVKPSPSANVSNNQSGLDPWTQAVRETVQSMETPSSTHRAINDLHVQFMDNLRMLDETKNRLSQLDEECSKKDELTKMQEITITTLTNMEVNIEQIMAEVKKSRDELAQDKSKMEKRATLELAEKKHKLDSSLGFFYQPDQ